ncbi:MAG: MFS transporter [Mucinivorans sp.]
MIRIQTGKGTMPIMTLLAIWSISLVVNLPGLAVSPLLGRLDMIFADTSQLEIQLLTIIPNLVIIPFVLISGRLAESRSKVAIVTVALLIYLVSGLAYLLANSMVELIVISAFLGLGCGLLIPLAASLLADSFTGKYRMQQLGIKSGIANISLVLATLAVGQLEGENWRLPFLVYLIPVIPLALAIFLPRPGNNAISTIGTRVINHAASGDARLGQRVVGGLIAGRLYGIVSLYFFVCYATVSVAYNLPFLMQQYAISSAVLGVVTALFFFAIFLPGLVLPYVIRILRQYTIFISLMVIALGLLVIAVSETAIFFGVGAVLMGFGFGVVQPIMYDKGVECAASERKVTLALSFVLATNYVAVTVAPLIVDGLGYIFSVVSDNRFAFILNFGLTVLVSVVSLVFGGRFVFRINDEYMRKGSVVLS